MTAHGLDIDRITPAQIVTLLEDLASTLHGARLSAKLTEQINDAALSLGRTAVKCGVYAQHRNVSDLMEYIGRAKHAAGPWYITGRPLADVIGDLRQALGEERA